MNNLIEFQCQKLINQKRLKNFLSTFPKNGCLIFCDINSNQNNLKNIFEKKVDGPMCILIGPEGDFSESERKMIIDHNQTYLNLY